MRTRFPGPFDVDVPPTARGWESMYNWYHRFGEDRRGQDETRFWFRDRIHHADVIHPFDEIFSECWWQGLGAFNTRVFAMPGAYGVDQRILGGRLYISPVAAPPAEVEARVAAFTARAGHYFEHWDAIHDDWRSRTAAVLDEIRSLTFDPLPDLEPLDTVFRHSGTSAAHRLVRDFDRLITSVQTACQYHFELLNIGYAACAGFFRLCREFFPHISQRGIAAMISGPDIALYRPDDELRRLAHEALRAGIADEVLRERSAAELFDALAEHPAGAAWLADWRATEDPWFVINTDPGHPGSSHRHSTWIDEPDIPVGSVRVYLRQLVAGGSIDRDVDAALRERDRITAEFRDLLADGDRALFDETVTVTRKVFRYVEEHVLYVEHWIWAAFWSRTKQLAATLTVMGALDDPEDMFLLRGSSQLAVALAPAGCDPT